jgi:hypothetical protein
MTYLVKLLSHVTVHIYLVFYIIAEKLLKCFCYVTDNFGMVGRTEPAHKGIIHIRYRETLVYTCSSEFPFVMQGWAKFLQGRKGYFSYRVILCRILNWQRSVTKFIADYYTIFFHLNGHILSTSLNIRINSVDNILCTTVRCVLYILAFGLLFFIYEESPLNLCHVLIGNLGSTVYCDFIFN